MLFPGHAACKGAIVKTSDVVKRYGCLSVSLFFNALGIALITQAHLGTTPITTLPYTLAAIFGLTLGTTTFACNLLFLLLQRILLRRRLGIAELLQIPAVLIFSVFIDFWMHLTGALVTDVYVWQIVMCIVGSAVLGAGISLEIMSNATVIPGEGLVIVIAARSRKNFGNIKVLFDCSLVLASCLLGLAVLGSIVGLREGTVLSAVLVGMFARLTSPWTRKLKPLLWSPEQRRLLRQIKAEIIRPAVEAGQIVICDRYTDSTLAYQGYGRGRDPDRLRRANDLATGGLQPDLTLLCDLPVSVGLERAGLRNRREGTVLSEGRFDSESLNFHERVRQGYLTIAAEEPDRIAIIDASQQPEDVVLQCLSAVERHLKQRGSGLE